MDSSCKCAATPRPTNNCQPPNSNALRRRSNCAAQCKTSSGAGGWLRITRRGYNTDLKAEKRVTSGQLCSPLSRFRLFLERSSLLRNTDETSKGGVIRRGRLKSYYSCIAERLSDWVDMLRPHGEACPAGNPPQAHSRTHPNT